MAISNQSRSRTSVTGLTILLVTAIWAGFSLGGGARPRAG